MVSEYSYALFITGNPGTGKSYVANNLGANFVSEFSRSGGGVTTDIQTARVRIGDHDVLLIDAPGLIEVSYAATQRNAKKITDALKLSKSIPFKIGIIVTDHNGRIQQSDMLLIRKVNEALHPKFEIFIIINQIRECNLHNYKKVEYLDSFVDIIRSNTGADVRIDRIVAMADIDTECQSPDMTPLTQLLERIARNTAKRVDDIKVSETEFNDRIVFYITCAIKSIAAVAYLVLTILPML